MVTQKDDLTVVPIPDSSSDQEHDRVRRSNDRDQELEREGRVSRHNRGYDAAADGSVNESTPETAESPDET